MGAGAGTETGALGLAVSAGGGLSGCDRPRNSNPPASRSSSKTETTITTTLRFGALAAAAIEDGVKKAVEDAKPLVEGDTGDPRYRAVVEAARSALKIIRG